MKKKKESPIKTLVLIIAGIIFLIWLFNISYEPQITITKEVCDDLGKCCDKKCVSFCNKIWQEAIEIENYNWNYTKCYEYNNCCEDSCEQVIVDEIELIRKATTDEWFDCLYNNTNHLNDSDVYAYWHTECKTKREFIPKKDLSIELLDENCELISFIFDGRGYSEKLIDGKRELSGGIKERKYKCGEYFVETWGQIK